jgi:metal-sulfur cluster biosynthetic enzyme
VTTATLIGRSRIAAALERVIDPELGINVVDLGLVYGIEVDDGFVSIELGLTTPSCPFSHRLAEDAAAAALNVPGVTGVDVALGLDPRWAPEMLSDHAREILRWR